MKPTNSYFFVEITYYQECYIHETTSVVVIPFVRSRSRGNWSWSHEVLDLYVLISWGPIFKKILGKILSFA